MNHSDESCPIVTRLDQIYEADSLESQSLRYVILRESFIAEYGCFPTFYARSPGRVNLIGEHIDYSGYSVYPMALLDKDMVIAVGITSTGGVQLANVDPKYAKTTFVHDSKTVIDIDPSVHEWSNYFKCGYKGVFEELGLTTSVSFQAMASGTVPAGAGVSSSSAFVCCSALATLTANGLTMSKRELTATAIRSEKYAGVQIGGMDQSISVMGLAGNALLIDFYPTLKATPIPFPGVRDPPVFVIANTLVTADKHVTAPTNYNLRVIETRLGAALLCKSIGLEVKGLLTFRELEDLVLGKMEKPLGEASRLDQMVGLVQKHLRETPYTLDEISGALGLSVDVVKETFIGSIVIRAEVFQLYQRALHVFGEAKRVFEFRDLCHKEYTDDSLLPLLGALMNASHASCRDLFNCSCPELDNLTQICRDAGAHGSRLTGAGWGGCCVSLVSESQVPQFIETVKSQYYFKKWPAWKSDPSILKKMPDFIFASKPGMGAALYRPAL